MMKTYQRMSTHELLLEHEYLSRLVTARGDPSRTDDLLPEVLEPHLNDSQIDRDALAAIESELSKR
jgi:hypothetical protein